MKKSIFISLLTIPFFMLAQTNKLIKSFNINAGKTMTTLLYKDASGNSNSKINYQSGNAYGVSLDLFGGKSNVIRAELLYHQAGAKTTFGSIPINWKLQYLGINCGYLFKLIDKNVYSFRPGILIGMDYLIKGEQTIGLDRYDMAKNSALKTMDANTGFILNNRFKMTETMQVFLDYRFNIGLNQIEKSDKGEKTRNMGHQILAGISINF
jgi:hypothetical protein